MNIQTVTNVSDCVPLYLPHSLYLKPLAKFYISVSLPTNKLGKTISNYDIMEKLSSAIKPDNYLVLKVAKSTLEFIRFEAELEDKTKLRNVLARLDGRTIKMSGFNDNFKVRVSEANDEFPSRHDWDSFFRDAKNMDEMKPGERPDTIHFSNLPIRWFCPRHMENDENVKPSENIFKRIFEKFGSVRCVDVPICDPYRSQMKTEITGMKTFNFDQEIMFEGYVQFSEYVGFVKAMDEFRGMKLIRKMGDKNQAVNIYANFDKTKHLSDASIKRRNIVRDRLIAKERAKQDEETRKKKEEDDKKEIERKKQEELKQKELEQLKMREEKRKEKHLKKIQEKGQLEFAEKIRMEERKLLIAQRKLESIRILEALFEKLKLKSKKNSHDAKNSKNKVLSSNDLRNKLVVKYKTAHANMFVAQKNKLKKEKQKYEKVNKKGLLALLEDGAKKRDSSPSINTISSDDSVLSDSHLNAKKNKTAKKKKSIDLTDSDSSSEDDQDKKMKTAPLNPFGALYSPEMAAEWLKMGIHPDATMFPGIPPIRSGFFPGAGIYPYAAMFPGIPPIRPGYFPDTLPFRGFPYRGRFPRGRGRSSRGRNQYYPSSSTYPYDNEQYYKYFKKMSGNRDHDYEDDHDRRRSRSYSRSRSRNHSRSRRSRSRRSRSSDSRSDSRDRSRGRRSRSRTRSVSKSRTRSRSRSRKHSRSKSKLKSRSRQKLVSTRRSRSSSSSHSWSRSRSDSRGHSWSKNRCSREDIPLQAYKLVRSAKEIQRSVQQKLHERVLEEEERNINLTDKKSVEPSTSKKRTRSRSVSIDSSKFRSPKRKERSSTPEKEWK